MKRFNADAAPRGGPRRAARGEVTIRDVARRAGVAVGTVSNVLNGSVPVADATAGRVREAIRALGYRVDLGARGLRSRRTHSVGLVLPNVSNPFYAEVARAVEHTLWERGLQTLLCDSAQDAERERMHLQALESRRVDGILMIRTAAWKLPRSPQDRPRVPVVFLDRMVRGLPSVTSDNRRGGEEAARHLAQLGHRQLAILAGENEVSNVRDRLAGFCGELARHGVSMGEDLVATGPQAITLGDAVAGLMARRPRPTAVFATNDIVAIGAWRRLLAMGLRIPEDVSLVGFDDIEMSSYLVPALTTIRQDKAGMAELAAGLLLALLRGQEPPSRLRLVPTRLVVRGSSGPPP